MIEARNGAEALQVVEQKGPGIHPMMTDVMIPGMPGKELASRASMLNPEMKVLFMTGYAEFDQWDRITR